MRELRQNNFSDQRMRSSARLFKYLWENRYSPDISGW